MARKDLIISYFASSPFLEAMLAQLETPYVMFSPSVADRKYKEYVMGIGNSVLSIWNQAKKPGDDLGRVAVLGFSEGCQGVRATLETKDASAIDTVIACDGIHSQRVGPVVEMSRLAPYIAFGKLAAATQPSVEPEAKMLAITHSSIGKASLPAGTVSTTETAEVIWTEVTKSLAGPVDTVDCPGGCPAARSVASLSQINWPNGFPIGTKVGGGRMMEAGWTRTRPSAPETGFLPPADFSWWGMADGWTQRRIANNLHAFGWSYDTPNRTKDPTGNSDHVFQANMVLPYVAMELLVRRWSPSCVGGTSGLGDASMCTPGLGKGYFEQEAAPLDIPTISPPKLLQTCPPPPLGKTIIGRPGDPCWTGEGAAAQMVPVSFSPLDALLVGTAAAGAGWLGATLLRRSGRI